MYLAVVMTVFYYLHQQNDCCLGDKYQVVQFACLIAHLEPAFHLYMYDLFQS